MTAFHGVLVGVLGCQQMRLFRSSRLETPFRIAAPTPQTHTRTRHPAAHRRRVLDHQRPLPAHHDGLAVGVDEAVAVVGEFLLQVAGVGGGARRSIAAGRLGRLGLAAVRV